MRWRRNRKRRSKPVFPASEARPILQYAESLTNIWEPRDYCELIRDTGEEAAVTAVWATRLRSRLALSFGTLALVGRSLRGGLIFHAIFQRADPLTQTFAQLRQFPGAEHQQSNKEDDQQVHRLK